jgi:hypothetical protein
METLLATTHNGPSLELREVLLVALVAHGLAPLRVLQ